MNDALITVVGFVAKEPYFEILPSGTPLMSLRVGSTPRRFDRDLGQWRDDEPTFLTVNCWRALAENLQGCDLKRGDPLIVTGRLRVREYTKDGDRRLSAQVDATTVGHDLSRGVARFQRSQRGGLAVAEDRRTADDRADRWLVAERADDETAELTGQAAEQSADTAESSESVEPTDTTFRAAA